MFRQYLHYFGISRFVEGMRNHEDVDDSRHSIRPTRDHRRVDSMLRCHHGQVQGAARGSSIKADGCLCQHAGPQLRTIQELPRHRQADVRESQRQG